MPHIHDNIDFCVEVFIVHENKVLLRKHDKYKIWLSVGGHVELNEDPNQAAIREVKEEVGLDVDLFHHGATPIVMDHNHTGLIPPVFTNRHKINDTHDHVVLVYFATSSTKELVLSNTTEVSDGCKWFTREELDNPASDLTKHVKVYAKVALDAISKE